jgi:Enterochelin esterase and related enzymes
MLFALAAYSQDAPITINNDNSVTITFVAPEAEDVHVQGNFFNSFLSNLPIAGILKKGGKADMKKRDDGVWTYTSAPLKPELYWYNFTLDDSDSTVYDMRNKNVTRDIQTIYNYFLIKGGLANIYADNTTAKGKLEYIWYPSTLNKMTKRRMAVYLPYGYALNKSQRFPVLYLLHGSGGDETSWPDCGRLVQIMDNLIATGKCEPMIVVMPNGNVELAAAPGDDPNNKNVKPSANNITSMFGKIEYAFVPEVVRFTDKTYRTLADKSHRAIAGLSLGGLHTLYIAINNPTTFDYIGLFSAQTTNALENNDIDQIKALKNSWDDFKKSLPFLGNGKIDTKISTITSENNENIDIYANFDEKIKNLYNNNPKLFYIAVGTNDFTKELNDNLRIELDKRNYHYLYNETDGGHTWTNWRRYLVDYLPKLFK